MKQINDSEMDEIIPLTFHLSQNYPNPFKDKTTIKYCVAYKTDVAITVANSDGELIKQLVNADQEAGTYVIEFNGSELPEGFYFVKITAGDYTNFKKMNLSK